MADQSWTDTDVELVADAYVAIDCKAHGWPIDQPCPACVSRAVLSALSAAGRLVPADAETRTEWASEHSGHTVPSLPDPWIQATRGDRLLAELRVSGWRKTHPGTHRLVSRQRVTVVGPWLPVPADTEETETDG